MTEGTDASNSYDRKYNLNIESGNFEKITVYYKLIMGNSCLRMLCRQ